MPSTVTCMRWVARSIRTMIAASARLAAPRARRPSAVKRKISLRRANRRMTVPSRTPRVLNLRESACACKVKASETLTGPAKIGRPAKRSAHELTMAAFDLFTIGHSNISATRFIAMQRAAGVSAVGDVRSTRFSRFCPWFSAKNLAPLLADAGIGYLSYGETLGGRPRDPSLYRDGVIDYQAVARQREFLTALDRLTDAAARRPVCIMCSEREPLDCHRCLLVARALAARGLAIGHSLYDGTIEPHRVTEQRLLALEGGDLFATGQAERLAAAYFRRARAVGYRPKPAAKAARQKVATEKR